MERENANKILAQSLDRGWRGLFDLRSESQEGGYNVRNQQNRYNHLTREEAARQRNLDVINNARENRLARGGAMKTIDVIIEDVFRIFGEEFGAKFVVTDSRMRVWRQILKDYDHEIILAASYHLVAQRQDWPPTIATMLRTVAYLSLGQLSAPDPHDAWG